MTLFLGIEYGRGCLRTAIPDGPALGPTTIKKFFPNHKWSLITPAPFDAEKCKNDRFGENFEIQKQIYTHTPDKKHIMIGGDHSVNYGHFVAIRDKIQNSELCLVYVDAHLDIHTPESAKAQASGAPHGTNVRALLGTGDKRWLSLQQHTPALRPENLFYLGTRSYEPAEIEFVHKNNIYIKTADMLATESGLNSAINEIRKKINNRPFVLSLDFDVIDPTYFRDVLVPAPNGITVAAAEQIINAFRDAYGFEFVEYAPTGDPRSAEIAKKLISILI